MSAARWLGEHLSRGVVVRRRMPRRVGGAILHVTPEASMRYWYRSLGSIDPSLLDLALEWVRRGDVVWDIGANVGYFAFAAAGLAGVRGKVLAVEPDCWLVTLLQRSVRANNAHIASVEVIPAAVSNRLGIERFHIAARGRAANYLANSNLGAERTSAHTVLVPTVTLDSLLSRFAPPSILKIDVEGAEAQVIESAEQLLGTVRPIVICEVGSENSPYVSKRLLAHDYLLYDAACPRAQRQPLPHAPWNTLAVPRNR